MSAVHPSLQLLHVQLLLPVLTAIEFTLQTTGCSTNLLVLRLNISILIENALIPHLVHERGDGWVQHEGDKEEEGEDADDAEGAEDQRDVVLQVLQAAPAQVGL